VPQSAKALKLERLKAILRGAFAGAPTPLKDIPKRRGEKRGFKKIRASASRASAKNARRAP
jgi:hypothetical protein